MSETNTQEPVVAIVVAAGSGVESGDHVPDALKTVGGVPLVARSVDRLAAGGCTSAIVVVTPGTADDFARALGAAAIPVSLVVGGAERQDSVRNGLLALDQDDALSSCRVVLVHDAVRALAPEDMVERVIAVVRNGAVAVAPVVDVNETIRQVNEVGSAQIDRSTLRVVQTPQAFDRATLTDAHALVAEHRLTMADDIAVCEFAGEVATLVPGDPRAFSIIDATDVALADVLVAASPRG